MQKTFNDVFDILNRNEIFLKGKIIEKYQFFYISNDNQDLLQKKETKEYFCNSNIIIIDKYYEAEGFNEPNNFIITSFKKNIIVVNQNSLTILQNLFNLHQNLKICFLDDSKHFFDQNFKIEYNEIENDENFKMEILSFNQSLKAIFPNGKKTSFCQVWKIIRSCISGYLIKESYQKLSGSRIDNFFKKQNQLQEPMNLKEVEYINLRVISIGSTCATELIYHIDKGELFAIKRQNSLVNDYSDLYKRELTNYLKLSHPFLPKYYGTIQNEERFVIEFINGQTMLNLEKLKLNKEDKITIIFELMIVLEFIHRNNLIYRDLKPSNVMIDKNKTVV